MRNTLYTAMALIFLLAQQPARAQKTTLLPISEKQYTEYAPTWNAKGTVMVFQSDDNAYKAWRLFESRLQKNGKWSKPLPIDSINLHGQRPGPSCT